MVESEAEESKEVRKVRYGDTIMELDTGHLRHRVMRERDRTGAPWTEEPYSGVFTDWQEKGVYVCAGCGNELFCSDTKYDAGCGWPSFSDVTYKKRIVFLEDKSQGMIRTEIRCSECDAHLGHVFPGNGPDGKDQYCVNSIAMGFRKKLGYIIQDK